MTIRFQVWKITQGPTAGRWCAAPVIGGPYGWMMTYSTHREALDYAVTAAHFLRLVNSSA